MNVISMFISATIMAIIGYLTAMLCKINVNKVISDLSAIFLFVPLIISLITTPMGDVEALNYFVTNYINALANALPGMIIGDIVGTLFAEVTKILGSFWET